MLGVATAGIDQYVINKPNKSNQFKVRVFADQERKEEFESATFTCQFNPESVSVSYNNDISRPIALGAPGASLTLEANEPEEIRCKLIICDSDVVKYSGTFGFDTKGSVIDTTSSKNSTSNVENKYKIIPLNSSNKGNLVVQYVEHFLNMTTQKNVYEGSNTGDLSYAFLKVEFGSIFTRPNNGSKRERAVTRQPSYPCLLQSVDVNYTLFSSAGEPLRAELDCVFLEDYIGENT